MDSKQGPELTRNNLSALSNGVGVDVALETTGLKSNCENAVRCVRRGGRVVQVDVPVEEMSSIPMARIAEWELELIGSHGVGNRDIRALFALMENGRLQPNDFVSKEVNLKEGADALQATEQFSLVIPMITRFRKQQLS